MRYVLPDVTMCTEYADFSNWWKNAWNDRALKLYRKLGFTVDRSYILQLK